ncbi:hypothetical protein [Saccharothrix sp. Mg75]|uniref:hypothetical protein n=1 Tax=Saccharothrix sp. Mg75 TaxID=3445357 RepID=UPI003EECFCDA
MLSRSATTSNNKQANGPLAALIDHRGKPELVVLAEWRRWPECSPRLPPRGGAAVVRSTQLPG